MLKRVNSKELIRKYLYQCAYYWGIDNNKASQYEAKAYSLIRRYPSDAIDLARRGHISNTDVAKALSLVMAS